MPSHEEHCQDSLRKYGKSFSELHKWMDEPCKVIGRSHRKYRHDPHTTPKEARVLFGEMADHACLDHIILDREEAEKITINVNVEEHPILPSPSISQPETGFIEMLLIKVLNLFIDPKFWIKLFIFLFLLFFILFGPR